MSSARIISEEIQQRRAEQDAKWGGPSNDDKNTSNDWVAFIVKHAGQAVFSPWDRSKFRDKMVDVAALAWAAIEWCDRRGAHSRISQR